jgi:transcriptional regulator with XRE-family HTH domain
MITCAVAIRILRTFYGTAGKDLAAKAGVSAVALSRFEHFRRALSPEEVRAVFRALAVIREQHGNGNGATPIIESESAKTG